MTTRHRLASLSFACVLLASAHAFAQQSPDGGTGAPLPADAGAGGVEAPPEGGGGVAAPVAHETVCNDHRDDDGDGLVDCADSDCFHGEQCESGGANENTDDRCSDWIDNDGDGMIDCDDDDCQGPGVTRCHGSWHGGAGGGNAGGGGGAGNGGDDAVPDLAPNQTVEDSIGTHGDIDGERTDEVCADGIDNDGDGRTDCSDFGCRYDPSVTVCAPTPSLRFSGFVGVALEYLRDEVSGSASAMGVPNPPDGFDANFSRVELRVLGPLPLIQNSFFQINVRLENTPRLVWALFAVPLGAGHQFNVNSGGGSLSVDIISGARKQLLLTPAFYEYRAFEQGNGASMEVAGPLTSNWLLQYRVFAGGGSGQFSGSVGGRFFTADNTNFTYTAGAQLQLNILGRYSRFDSPFIWNEVRSPTIAILAGGKWDQRAQERYIAWYGFAVARAWRFELRAETYGKAEFAFNYGAESWRVQLAFLIWEKMLLLGADVGGYYPGNPTPPPTGFGSATIQRPLQEFQWRVALHLNLYREFVRLSLVFTDHYIAANPDIGHLDDTVHEQILHLEMQFMW